MANKKNNKDNKKNIDEKEEQDSYSGLDSSSTNDNKISSFKSSSSSKSSSYYGSDGSEGSDDSSDNNMTIDSDSSDVDYSKNGNELTGEVINNQYMLLYKIGYGSFSSVWLTYDISDDKFYALKIQTPDDYDEGIKELEIYDMISKICKQNKNIDTMMTIKTSFILEREEGKYVCMVMELMAGSLYDVIKTDKYSEGIPEESVNKVDKQLMDSISVLHNFGIIHTDIKPENILVCGVNKKYQTIIDKFTKLKLKQKFDENIGEIKAQYNLKNRKHKDKFRQDKYLILLELNKFIHEIIDFETVLDDRTSDLFTEEQINNIKIKLADFGSIQYEKDLKKKDWYPEVTTRYYRDPRVILGLSYDKTIDIHSAKTTMYEIKTGKIQYNPDALKDEDGDNDFSTDYYHILLLMKDGLVKPQWLKACKKDELKDEITHLLKQINK
jgi:serine/threonine protein kinase